MKSKKRNNYKKRGTKKQRKVKRQKMIKKQKGGNEKCLSALLKLTSNNKDLREKLFNKFNNNIRKKLVEEYIKDLSNDKNIIDKRLETNYNKNFLNNYFKCLKKINKNNKNKNYELNKYFYYEL